MGDLQRYLRHLIVFKGPTSKGREGKERAGEGKVKGREGKRRWRQGFGLPKKFGMAPLMLFYSIQLNQAQNGLQNYPTHCKSKAIYWF